METNFTNEEMTRMHADYIRDKIVRGIQDLSPNTTRTLEITSVGGDITLIDVSLLSNNKLTISSFVRSSDRDVTARINAEFEDVKVCVGYDVSIQFIDPLGFRTIILYPDRIRSIYWGDVIY